MTQPAIANPTITNGSQNVGIVPRDVALTMSGQEFLRGLLDGSLPAPPFSLTAGITPLSLEEGRVVFEGKPSREFYNPMGIVHGGWMAMLLDTVMGCAVHSALKAGQAYTTLEMKTTFVRAILEDTGPLRAEGVLLHIGGRVASSEGKLLDSAGRLVAHGSETCLIMKPGGA